MEKHPIPVLLKLTRALLFVDAAVWLVFVVLSCLPAMTGGSALRWVLILLMGINAGILFWFGVMIVSARKAGFTLAILYMALNVVLSITDQFGLIDAVILSLNLCVLASLVVSAQRMKQTAWTPLGEP